MSDMRSVFAETASALLDEDPLAAVVLAEISVDMFGKAAARHPDRVLNVGIREQLMVSVGGGLALAGILALTQGGAHSLDGLGVALALIAGCLWGAYIILNGRVGRAYERGTGVALSMCIASVALLPVGIASGGSNLLEPKSLAIGAAVGVLSSAIPYSFEQEALRRIAASVFPPSHSVLVSSE